MADQKGLRAIGLGFAAITVAIMLVATLTVRASDRSLPVDRLAAASVLR